MERTTKATIMFIVGMILGWGVIIGIEHFTRTKNETKQSNVCKADSLQNVIDSLGGEYQMRTMAHINELDNAKSLIAKYETGLLGLDKKSKREFIRYAMMREEYDERLGEEYEEENHKFKNRMKDASYK